jgi:hypothetical protein
MSLADTSVSFFESLYAEREDPWDFAPSNYEHGRYEVTRWKFCIYPTGKPKQAVVWRPASA